MATKRTTKTTAPILESVPTPVKKRTTAAHRPKKVAAKEVLASAVLADFTQEIASLAYFLWLDRGKTDGHADADWFRAEQTVKAKYGLQT